jgi:hypothetical protein
MQQIPRKIVASASSARRTAHRNRNAHEVHEDFEHRADNSATGLPVSGLRTFGATPQLKRAVDLAKYL